MERETVARMPERVTNDWLARQPLWRFKQIIEGLPDADLDRLIRELKAEIEATDETSSAQA
ncbi:MAG: hypothetical protein P8Z76_21230 [Alphaproteobacteria bacterium]